MNAAFAQRVRNLQPEGAYRVMAMANALERQGRDVLHLEIGQPDFPTFEPIRRAGKAAIDDGHTRYCDSAGYSALKAAIAQRHSTGSRTVDPSEVVVGPGAKPGLVFPLLALLSPGDEVLYPDPGFPTYRAAIELASASPVPVPLIEAEDFCVDLDRLRRSITPRTRLCILNSPANPTGGVVPAEAYREVARLAQEHGFWILSDEIYSRLNYSEERLPSLVDLPEVADRAIVVDGFSKTFSMTGWRLGYTIMPASLAEKVSVLLVHSIGCTAGFTQMAGIAALEECDPDVANMVEVFRQRRDLIVDRLNQLPRVSCRRPDGAFYAFPNVSRLGIPSRELALRLLEEAGIACLSGTDFGRGGEGYLRFSYATSLEVIEQAMDRFAQFIEGRP